MRYSRLATAAGLLGAATLSVAVTTVSVIILDIEPQPLVGSVIGVQEDRTTFVVSCPKNTIAPNLNATGCGATDSHTIVQGPSTWESQLTFPATSGTGDLYATIVCNLDFPKDVGSCSLTETVDESGTTSRSSEVDAIAIKSYMYPVTITAGAEKLAFTNATQTGIPTAAIEHGVDPEYSCYGKCCAPHDNSKCYFGWSGGFGRRSMDIVSLSLIMGPAYLAILCS